MKKIFTRLVCVSAILISMSVSMRGQNKMLEQCQIQRINPNDTPIPSLRIGEEMGDSIAVYDASGEKLWSTTEVWSEPVCRIFVDELSRPGTLVVLYLQ